jgi:hypothetical protein
MEGPRNPERVPRFGYINLRQWPVAERVNRIFADSDLTAAERQSLTTRMPVRRYPGPFAIGASVLAAATLVAYGGLENGHSYSVSSQSGISQQDTRPVQGPSDGFYGVRGLGHIRVSHTNSVRKGHSR